MYHRRSSLGNGRKKVWLSTTGIVYFLHSQSSSAPLNFTLQNTPEHVFDLQYIIYQNGALIGMTFGTVQVTQLSAELEEVQLSSSETSELLESLQYEKLKLQEELGSITVCTCMHASTVQHSTPYVCIHCTHNMQLRTCIL